MSPLPLLPLIAVALVVVDLVVVAPWSGVCALVGALLLLEPLFLERTDQPVTRSGHRRRTLPTLQALGRIPTAVGTLSRVRRYLLMLFALFFVLRVVALVFALDADEETVDALATGVRLYDAALALTGLMLAVLQEKLHLLGSLALFLAHRPAILLLTSFAVMIGVGTLLLMLPIAVTSPAHLSIVDALFTITSGVCVTGLAPNDFAAVYTDFGHAVTLLGIQLGGIGIMTVAALATTFGRGSLERTAGYSATFEAKSLADLRSLVRTIILYTVAFEALGTLLLWLHWRDAAWLDGRDALWLALFHAVSAFCNAGFSLFSDNLVRFQGDAWTQLVLMGLVLTGGIGFAVMREVAWQARRSFLRRVLRREVPWRRTPVGVKVAIATSAILLVLGALGIGASEAYGVLDDLSPGEQALNATFTSVVSRSAGFNTLDMTRLAPPTLFMVLLLMFVGGSPGSTAGGIKTNTLAVLLATLRGELRGREPELFGRAIDPRTIRRAVSVAALSLGFTAMVVLVLIALEPEKGFLPLAFETVSAIATAGLSTGITAGLGDGAKLILTMTMFVGRVGPLTVAYAVGREHATARHRLATEEITVG